MLRLILGFLIVGVLYGVPRDLDAAPMRIGVPSPSVSYFPLIVAWKKGFFTQEGIRRNSS